MREFFRIFVWGTVAAVSLTLAIFAGSTEAGSDRARHAALQLREVVMPSGVKPAKPLDAVEGRKLAETVRVLAADRERLLARIATLENNVDDITGSIKRVERAARPVPTTIEQPFSPVTALPPQPPLPAKPQPALAAAPPAQAPPTVAAPPPPVTAAMPPARLPPEQVTASITPQHDSRDNALDQTQDAAPAAPETAPAQAATPPNRVTRRQFGLDLGGAATEDALRPVWTTALRRHNALLQSLRPLVLSRAHPRGGGVEYRLIAGPIANAAKAARYCAAITGTGGVCQPTMYDGQKLASH
ncbi:MAG: hypothetical protein K2Y27_22970 [Xanthobacteraceae bacterium]|nr:hypothetical protein [Xanthobacteraceae bacterium]